MRFTAPRAFLSAVLFSIGFASPAMAKPHGHGHGHHRGHSTVSVGFVAPRPAPIPVTYRPVMPAPHAVWISGSWAWTGRAWTWQQGYWQVPTPVRRPVAVRYGPAPRYVQPQPAPRVVTPHPRVQPTYANTASRPGQPPRR